MTHYTDPLGFEHPHPLAPAHTTYTSTADAADAAREASWAAPPAHVHTATLAFLLPAAPPHPDVAPRLSGGVAPSVRPAVWAHLLRAHSLRASHPSHYAALLAACGPDATARAHATPPLHPSSAAAATAAAAAHHGHHHGRRSSELSASDGGVSFRSASHTSLLALEAEAGVQAGPVAQGVVAQIGKDLSRTFPNHPGFRPGGALRASLGNILVAYAAHNPGVGYCQGMNFLVGLLLLVTPDDEELVFWEAVAVLEGILVNYYAPTLVGALVDIRVLRALLADAAPDVAAVVSKEEIHIVASSWFLSLFVNTFTPRSVLLILDSLFCTGTSLFLVATAVATLALSADHVAAHGSILNLRPPASAHLIYADPAPILARAHAILASIPLATLDTLRSTSLADIQRSNEHAHQLDTLFALVAHARDVTAMAVALSILPPDLAVVLPSRGDLDALLVRVQTRFGGQALLAPLARLDRLAATLGTALPLDDTLHALAGAAAGDSTSSDATLVLDSLVDTIMLTLAELVALPVGELMLDVLRHPLLASALAYYGATLHIRYVFQQAPSGLPFSPPSPDERALSPLIPDAFGSTPPPRSVFLCDDASLIHAALVAPELVAIADAADAVMEQLTAFIRDSTSELSERVIHVLANVSNTLNILEDPLDLAARQYSASARTLTLVAAVQSSALASPAARQAATPADSLPRPASDSSPASTLLQRLFSSRRPRGQAPSTSPTAPGQGDGGGGEGAAGEPSASRKSRGEYKLEETILELLDTKAMVAQAVAPGAGLESPGEPDAEFVELAARVSSLLQIILENYYEFVFDLAFDGLSHQSLAPALLASAASPDAAAALSWTRATLTSPEFGPPRILPRLLATHYVGALRTSSRARIADALDNDDTGAVSLPSQLNPVVMFGLQALPLPAGPGELYALGLLQELVFGPGNGPPPAVVVKLDAGAVSAPLLFAPLDASAVYLDQLLNGALFARADARAAHFAAIDGASFAMAAIMAMLGDVSGSGASYVLVADGHGGKYSLKHCLSYDAGLAFADPVVNDVAGGTAHAALANILFTLPNMHDALPADIVGRLLGLYPERVILSWMARLRLKNQVFESGCELGVFSTHEMDAMGLPLRFVPGAPTRVYERLRRLQSLLTAKAQAVLPTTPFEVLSHLLPMVAASYLSATESAADPAAALSAIVNRTALPLPSEEPRMLHRDGAHRDEYRGVSRELRRSGVCADDHMEARIVAPAAALHVFLMHVNWAELAPLERQDRFLRAIRLVQFLQYLVIRYDSVNDDEDADSLEFALTDASLESLLASLTGLRRLRLDCPLSNVSVGALLRLSHLRSGSLSIELRPGLGMGIAGWAELTREIPILLVLCSGSALFRIPLRAHEPAGPDPDDPRAFSSVLAVMWPDIVRLLHVVIQLDDYATGLFLLAEVQAVGEAEHKFKMAAAAAQLGLAGTGYLSPSGADAAPPVAVDLPPPREQQSGKGKDKDKKKKKKKKGKDDDEAPVPVPRSSGSGSVGPSFVQALVNARLNGMTPLQRAVHAGSGRMIDLLLANTASLDIVGSGSGGRRGSASTSGGGGASSSGAGRSGGGGTSDGSEFGAELALAQAGCGVEEPVEVDVEDDGEAHAWSPLTYAVIRGEESIVERLLAEYKARGKDVPAGVVDIAKERGTPAVLHMIRSAALYQ